MAVEAEVKRDFEGILADVSAVILWGSHAAGTPDARSDIDVCIVAGPGVSIEAALQAAWKGPGSSRKYDVRVFEELPLYLKGAVLDHGRVAMARDEPALSEYLRPYRKAWDDERRRATPTAEDIQRMLEVRRARG